MSLSWGTSDVRVYAAEAWVSLAVRFAADHPVIVDRLEDMVADPIAAVRLQVARNLQVICVAAPERMWAMGTKLAQDESDDQLLASYLNSSMRRFSHSDPDRCEDILDIVRGRLISEDGEERKGRDHVQESLGGWTAQLFAGQARDRSRGWLAEWAQDPSRYGAALDAFLSSLRGAFFYRYEPSAEPGAIEMCDRAQAGLALILEPAIAISTEAYAVLITTNASESDKKAAGSRYGDAEKVVHHAMNQLYFGSGAQANEREPALGLPDHDAMAQFLVDYARILALLAASREPATLHHLIELYEYLIPGEPIAVFEAIHAILLGPGEQEGYQHESLANSAVVRIVRRYIADYRGIFEDAERRARLVGILQLFSEVGWTEALKLLYDLPDLLR